MPFTARGTWINSRRAATVLHLTYTVDAAATVCGVTIDHHTHTTTQYALINCPVCRRLGEAAEQARAIKAMIEEVGLAAAPSTVCGYCHATVPAGDYIAHDIQTHSGLHRVRDTHVDVCQRWGDGCICRLREYEAAAAGAR